MRVCEFSHLLAFLSHHEMFVREPDAEETPCLCLGISWMNARDLFSDTWRDLARRYNCKMPSAQAVLDELLGAYSEPNRHYHAIEHIASLLRQMEDHKHAIVDRDAVALAVLFHDVIYDPLRHDNEEKSATLARERLAWIGFPREVVAKVERYIHATTHSDNLETND